MTSQNRNSSRSNHPDQERLCAFVTGDVEEAELEQIASHLEVCAECCNWLQDASAFDKLTERLQKIATQPATPALERATRAAAWILARHTAVPNDQAPAPNLPEQVQQYRIMEEVGRGGMGVVYRAEDVALRRPVALKMILAGQFASVEQRVRFRLEAEMAARVHHENVVQVYEVGEYAGQPFVAYEWLPNGNLVEYCRIRQLSPRQIAQLVEKLATAVHLAHLQGVIHRDLKPANVLMSEHTPKIVDFGIARRWDLDNGFTLTGSLLGTPEYMAPEQALGDSKLVGPATDVYALGTILYELLTGQPPFRGSSPIQIIQRIASEDPPPLRSGRHTVPRDLQAITLKCLHKSVSRRYSTAEVLAEDLRRFLQGLPTVARPMGSMARWWQWCRRYPGVASLLVLLVCSLLSGTIISSWFAFQANDQARQAQLEAQAAQEAKQLAQRMADSAMLARQDAQAQAYDARALLLQSAWRNHESLRFNQLIQSLRPQPNEEDLRGFEWYYWQQKLRSGHKSLESNEGLLAGTRFTRDGQHIIFGGLSGNVSMIDAQSLETIWTTNLVSGQVFRVQISPDDRLAVAVCAEKTHWLDVASGTVIRTLNPPVQIGDIQFSQKNLFTIDGQGLVQAWDIETGEEIDRLQCESRRGPTLAVTQDGSRVTTLSAYGRLQQWDMKSKKLTASSGDANIAGNQLSLSPDETLLAVVNTGGQLQICDALTLIPKSKPIVASVVLDCVDFDSTSQKVLVGGFDSLVRCFDAQTGVQLETYLAHVGQVSCVMFHPSDNSIFVSGGADSSLRVWNKTYSPNPLVHYGAYARPRHVGLHPQKDQIAFTSNANNVECLNLDDGQVQSCFCPKEPLAAIAYSSDGKWLATASFGGRVACWDTQTNTKHAEWSFETTSLHSIQISPNCDQIACSGSEGAVYLCSLKTAREPLKLPGHVQEVSCVRFNSDGTSLISSSFDGTIRMWDAATGQPKSVVLQVPTELQGFDLSPDEQHLAVAGEDERIRIVNIKTGAILQELSLFGGPVRDVAYSPDGRRLAAGNWRRSVTLWDTTTGQAVLQLDCEFEDVMDVLFTRDGQRLVAICNGGGIHVWHAPK